MDKSPERRTVIYLASPYNHDDPNVQELRYWEACRAAAQMMRAGWLVFSPIAHSHPIARFGLPGDFAFWETLDKAWIDRCDELVVLTISGWRDSVGVTAEIEYARQRGLPIRYVDPDELHALERSGGAAVPGG